MNALTLANFKLVCGIACALALAVLVHDRNRWKAAAGARAAQVAAERSAHAGTIANYRAAAAQARAADAAHAERTRLAQARINERTADDFERRIAQARARAGAVAGSSAGGLRRPPAIAAADPGAGRGAPMPALPAPAGSAAQAAGQDRLPPPDALIATEQAIQLDELIRWVKAQAGAARH